MAEQLLQQDQQSRSTGKVSWFAGSKGYGFITPDDGGEDLFVHQSSIKSDGYRSLTIGESVEFTVSTGNGGKAQAVGVIAIGGSAISKRDRRGGSGYGGGWRGGNDRRNDSGCYNCGDLNHLARDCDREGTATEARKATVILTITLAVMSVITVVGLVILLGTAGKIIMLVVDRGSALT